jgi:hypothetical protein
LQSRTAALALLLLTGGSLSAQQKPELLFPGDILGNRVWPRTGERWLGLYRTDTGFRLAPTRIKVERIPDACAGTATRISADTTAEPYLLIKGHDGFKPGPVDTAFAGREFLYPAQSMSIRIGKPDRWYSLLALGTAFRRPGDILIRNYTVALSGLVFLELPLISTENTPDLLWAGDLDRDKGLDLLFKTPVGDYGKRYVLFLSSAATPPELVKPAASFDAPDC